MKMRADGLGQQRRTTGKIVVGVDDFERAPRKKKQTMAFEDGQHRHTFEALLWSTRAGDQTE